MALTHPGWAILIVLLVAASGPVAAAHVAPAHETPTVDADATFAATGTPLDEPTDPTNDTTDDTTNTTDDTTDNTTNTTDDTTNTSENTTDAVDNTTTDDPVDNTTTDDPVDNTTNTVDDTTNTTDDTVDTTTNETVNATTEGTDSVNETTDTVNETTSTVNETTSTVNETTSTVNETTSTDSSSVTTDTTLSDSTLTDSTRTDTSLTNTSLTDSSLADTTSDTLDGTEETTDDVSGVVVEDDDDEESLDVSSGSDSGLLLLNAAATTGSDDDSAAGSTAGENDGGDGGVGGGDEGDSDGGDAETSVNVEAESQSTGPVSRVVGAAWETLDGYIPEDAPVGPAGAAGVGALAVVAVASRQWFVQSTTTGMPSLLTSGVSGHLGDWVEKLKRLAVPLRYSRYDDSDPLEHDTRRVLHDAIDAAPGINLTTLAEQTDVPLSTARHHVRVLEDENLVTTAKRHGKRRFYPVGADDVALTDALSEPPKAAVLHTLAHHGEAHVGLLADELDRDPSTITHHLQALADDGLVEREKHGRTVVNRLSESAQSTLGGDTEPSADYKGLPADD